MSVTFTEIAQQARKLVPEERARLVELLLESLQAPTPCAIEAAWNHEVSKRVAAYDKGDAESFPAEDVFAKAKRLAR